LILYLAIRESSDFLGLQSRSYWINKGWNVNGMTIMLNNQRKAGSMGMIQEDLKSGGTLVWLALVNYRVDGMI
jgi:hypothetical protein